MSIRARFRGSEVIGAGALGVLIFAASVNVFAKTGEGVVGTYTVTDEVQSLREIAILLYGTVRAAPELAGWNGIPEPYMIFMGQKLVLKNAPSVTPEEGRKRLLAMWRKQFGLEVAEGPVTSKGATEQKLDSSVQAPAGAPVPTPTPEPTPEPTVDQQVVAIIQQAEASAKEAEVKAQVEDAPPTAEGLFKSGETAFKAGDYEKAAKDFRQCREMDPQVLPAWFYELQTLRLLNKEAEVKEVAEELVDENPDVRDFPVVEQYLGVGSGAAE